MPASTNNKVASFNAINITLIVLGLLVFLMSGFLAAAVLVAAHALAVTFISFVGYAIMHAIAAQAALNLFMLIAAGGLGLALAVIFTVKLLNFTNDKIIQPIARRFGKDKWNSLQTNYKKIVKTATQHDQEYAAQRALRRQEDRKDEEQKRLASQSERLAAEADRQVEYLASLTGSRSNSSSSTSSKDKKDKKKHKKSGGHRIKEGFQQGVGHVVSAVKSLSPRPRGSNIASDVADRTNSMLQIPSTSPQTQQASSNPGSPIVPPLNISGIIPTPLSPRSDRKDRLFDQTAPTSGAQPLVSPRGAASSSSAITSSLQTASSIAASAETVTSSSSSATQSSTPKSRRSFLGLSLGSGSSSKEKEEKENKKKKDKKERSKKDKKGSRKTVTHGSGRP